MMATCKFGHELFASTFCCAGATSYKLLDPGCKSALNPRPGPAHGRCVCIRTHRYASSIARGLLSLGRIAA